MTQPEESPTTSSPKSVFVISPIGTAGTDAHTHALKTLNFVIRKALAEPEWKVIRADFEDAPDSITQLAIRRIIESDLVVANLTGHNPNVFYELAVAHSFSKPVVMMTAAEGPSLPFDITDQRCIFYDLTDPQSVDESKDALLERARYALKNPDVMKTPLSEYAKIAEISAKASAGDETAVSDIIGQVLERLDGIEASIRKSRLNDANRRVKTNQLGLSSSNERITAGAKLASRTVQDYERLRNTPAESLTNEERDHLDAIESILGAQLTSASLATGRRPGL